MPLRMDLVEKAWPMREPFAIARGVQSDQPTLIVTLTDAAGRRGRGEGCGVDYAGETPATMRAQLEALRDRIARGLTRRELADLLPAGGARCALDAALWDLEARQQGRTVAELAGIAPLKSVTTAYTIGIRSLAAYEETARRYAAYPVLKIKVDGSDPVAVVAAVRRGAPDARLIVDANQSWSVEALKVHAAALAGQGVVLLEQPVPVGAEAGLDHYRCPIPIAADELINGVGDLARAKGRFDVINIKLDKTGGLTEALALREAARARGLMIMAGCMVATSLAMAPALLIAQGAEVVDLDGPLLLAKDRVPGLSILGSMIEPPPAELWG